MRVEGAVGSVDVSDGLLVLGGQSGVEHLGVRHSCCDRSGYGGWRRASRVAEGCPTVVAISLAWLPVECDSRGPQLGLCQGLRQDLMSFPRQTLLIPQATKLLLRASLRRLRLFLFQYPFAGKIVLVVVAGRCLRLPQPLHLAGRVDHFRLQRYLGWGLPRLMRKPLR